MHLHLLVYTFLMSLVLLTTYLLRGIENVYTAGHFSVNMHMLFLPPDLLSNLPTC